MVKLKMLKNVVGKPEVKRPLGGPKHRREDNIKIYLKDIVPIDMELIHLAQHRDRCWLL
jgi:hypothetical protein